jgi:cardiolipin synthase
MKLKNIPNILSIIRIILVAVFVYAAFWVSDSVALVVFLIAGATDVVDGYLARRNNWITDLGKILDPFADKLMQCTVLVSLYIKKLIPIWFVIPFFAKEIFTLFIGLIVIKRRSVVVVSKWYGKLTVCLFYLTIVVSVVFAEHINGGLNLVVFLPAVICAVVTLFAYIKHYAGLRHKVSSDTETKNGSETAKSC